MDELPENLDVRKRRFCASFPNFDRCKQGSACPYAHGREEVLGAVCTEKEEAMDGVSSDFFVWTYKTIWCPIGAFHDWQECIYAHNYQDLRRDPRIGYSTKACPEWARANRAPEYASRCPRGYACGHAHGAKEQLYHPAYFRTILCNDHFTGRSCPRGRACAFYHQKKERRQAVAWPNHGDVITSPVIRAFLQPDIHFPPFGPPEGGEDSAREAPVVDGSALREAPVVRPNAWAKAEPPPQPSEAFRQLFDLAPTSASPWGTAHGEQPWGGISVDPAAVAYDAERALRAEERTFTPPAEAPPWAAFQDAFSAPLGLPLLDHAIPT